ncbi:putative hydrolase (HAD superfamily) [Fusarium austroafricanum]|uniref:Putative hydrolase (HAD superfamily) n=1 Tax=Fusarium austroafricanum TaxID=2364996 RepID=A0A8H4NWB4_9HYPO|nr:putative hydrolase (HAD superfamily) [Fusarium austroafricanum]
MSKISDFSLLSFDVYGTLIDWETGVLNGLRPLLQSTNAEFSQEHILKVYHDAEVAQQEKTPDMKYSELLATIHPHVAERLNLPKPTAEQDKAFGDSIGSWPAFSDTVDALHRLRKHYKLVVLSNVDRESFSGSNAGPLQGVPFDLIITAQDVGSYKPNLKNFEYMLREVNAKFKIPKEKLLQTAQSQFHDHQPATKMGIRSSWIERPGAIIGNRGDPIYDWKFAMLGDMAGALEKELAR